jgi:hypothetical protein
MNQIMEKHKYIRGRTEKEIRQTKANSTAVFADKIALHGYLQFFLPVAATVADSIYSLC